MTNHVDTAEDLLQEVFERFIDYSLTHEIDISTVRPFLYRTAHNLAVNHHVRGSKRQIINIDAHEDLHTTPDTIHAELESEELEKRVDIFIASLPADDRSIFIMHKELSKTYDDIARETGISSRTARRRIRSILDRMMKTLQDEGFL